MGNQISQIITAICPCESCAKYVFNSCHFNSKCTDDCCIIEFETQEIEINEDEDLLEITNCCYIKKRNNGNWSTKGRIQSRSTTTKK